MNTSPKIVLATAKVAVIGLVISVLLASLSSRWPRDVTVEAFQYHSSFSSSVLMHRPHYFSGDASTVYSSNQIQASNHRTSASAIIGTSYRPIADVPTRSRCIGRASSSTTEAPSTTTNVLVIGGTSGIGQLVTQKLANSNRQPFTVRATSRSKARGEELFQGNGNIKVVELDLLQEDTTQLQAAMEGVSVVVISVGTTAFPTMKWKGGNTPVAIDNDAVTRIAKVASEVSSVQQVILVTSVGVERTNVMPFLILNLFGVLDAKRAGEDAIRQYSTANSGYQYSIIRPGRLVGGPFTNLDVAKLLQIQGGTENGVTMTKGDALLGDCKRDACAECIVQCITTKPITATTLNNLEFSIISNDQPALNEDEWSAAFQSLT
jgi:nucleoside-diphosphate-sugar epimerase